MIMTRNTGLFRIYYLCPSCPIGAWLGPKKSKKIRLVVMDMWRAFRKSTLKKGNAPQAKILYDKFHVVAHLQKAMDQVRKSEYARLRGKDRQFIKGQRYNLLSHKRNLSLQGKKALKVLLAANKRLNTAYVLKEQFEQLWECHQRFKREPKAR
jgi:transposase